MDAVDWVLETIMTFPLALGLLLLWRVLR